MFEPHYSPNYQIITIHGANRIEVQDEKGHRSVRRAGHVKRIEPVDKVCQQLLPEEVYKQFGRASKLLLHPKDVPDVKLVEEKETINCENRLEDRKDDNVILYELTEQLDSHEKAEKSINTVFPTKIVHDTIGEEGMDEKSSKETINRFGNHSTTEHTEQWTALRKHTYPSDYSKNLFNRFGGVKTGEVSSYEGEHTGQWTLPKESTYPSNYGKKSLNCFRGAEGEGGYLLWTRIADNHEVQSDKCEKLHIRCNFMERNLHSMNVELYVQRKDQLDKREGSEKSINLKHQIQCNHSVDKKLKPMLATLCEVQCENSKKSIIQPSETRDNEELKVPSNSVVEKTDKTKNVDLQQGWGKAVSFITNTSDKLSLSSVLHSLT